MTARPPLRKKTDLSLLTTGNTVQERLRARYGALQDWKAVGAENGVSGGMAYRVATSDYEPRDNGIRSKLGLPVMAPVPVCIHCGVPHVTKRCTAKQAGKPRKPSAKAVIMAALGLPWG